MPHVVITSASSTARTRLREIFEVDGHRVEEAETWLEGIAACLQRRTDLFLVDEDLAGASAAVFQHTLRSAPHHQPLYGSIGQSRALPQGEDDAVPWQEYFRD